MVSPISTSVPGAGVEFFCVHNLAGVGSDPVVCSVEPPVLVGVLVMLPGVPGLVSLGSKITVFLMVVPACTASSLSTVTLKCSFVDSSTPRFVTTHST